MSIPIPTAKDLVVQPGFQPPRYIDDLSRCYFYHSMELPGLGLQRGSWDLRKDVQAYLGNQNFSGKKVVDVGTASGYLAFEMEKRGAEVTAFDRLVTTAPDEMGLVPFSDSETRFGLTLEQAIQARMDSHLMLQNSFWMSHRLLGSRIRLYCGNAYHCPPELGQFDCAFFGAILLHLRDPLQALTSFARATRETIIVTDTFENIGGYAEAPVMFLRPSIQDNTNPGTWWYITPALLRNFFEILGFRKTEVSYHQATWVESGRAADFYTIVAERE